MTTFPNVDVIELRTVDAISGDKNEYADLPCMTCIIMGSNPDRFKVKATHLVVVSDLLKMPMCQQHAEDFSGDKR